MKQDANEGAEQRRQVRLGVVPTGFVIPVDLTFENRSGKQLTVISARTSCGCVALQPPANQPWYPGKSIRLPATVQTSWGVGRFHELATLVAVDGTGKEILANCVIEGAARNLIDMTPPAVLIESTVGSRPPARVVAWDSSEEVTGRLTVELQELPSWLHIESVDQENSRGTVLIRADPSTEAGLRQGEVKLSWKDYRPGSRRLSVLHRVLPSIMANPRTLILNLDRENEAQLEVTCRQLDNDHRELLGELSWKAPAGIDLSLADSGVHRVSYTVRVSRDLLSASDARGIHSIIGSTGLECLRIPIVLLSQNQGQTRLDTERTQDES